MSTFCICSVKKHRLIKKITRTGIRFGVFSCWMVSTIFVIRLNMKQDRDNQEPSSRCNDCTIIKIKEIRRLSQKKTAVTMSLVILSILLHLSMGLMPECQYGIDESYQVFPMGACNVSPPQQDESQGMGIGGSSWTYRCNEGSHSLRFTWLSQEFNYSMATDPK